MMFIKKLVSKDKVLCEVDECSLVSCPYGLVVFRLESDITKLIYVLRKCVFVHFNFNTASDKS